MSKIVKAGPGLHVGDYMLAQTLDRGKTISKDPKIIQGHKLDKIRVAGKDYVTGGGLDSCSCDRLDLSWLPMCSDLYQISPSIEDYVIVEVPLIMANGSPNRNGDSFNFEEVTSWKPLLGVPQFLSIRGKPVHRDHDNADPTKAKGVVLDSTLKKYGNVDGHKGIWHISVLKAFCRQKDPKLAQMVQQRNRVGHSMGALVEKTVCSLPWCSYESNGVDTCQHIQGGAGKGQVIRQHLVYEQLFDTNLIESSSVDSPASVTAMSEYFVNLHS